jgi:S1-C subfamily serine protease
VIKSIDGKAVSSASALSAVVDEHKPGDTVQLKVSRNGSEKTLNVKLGQRPDSAQTSADTQDQQQQQAPDPGTGGGW